MQVLNHHHDRLGLALTQEQTLRAVEDLLASLRWIELLPMRIVRRQSEEPQARGQERLERAVERQQPPRHLLAYESSVVPAFDPEVSPQQIDEGEVRRCLAVGHRSTRDHEAVLDAMGVSELIIQAGFPHAGLADHGDDLAPSGARVIERLVQLLHLSGSPDECRQPARRRRLKARADGGGAQHLVYFDWLRQALDRHWTEGLDLDLSLDERERVGAEQARSGICKLLHARS